MSKPLGNSGIYTKKPYHGKVSDTNISVDLDEKGTLYDKTTKKLTVGVKNAIATRGQSKSNI